jgi:hypothetical protein
MASCYLFQLVFRENEYQISLPTCEFSLIECAETDLFQKNSDSAFGSDFISIYRITFDLFEPFPIKNQTERIEGAKQQKNCSRTGKNCCTGIYNSLKAFILVIRLYICETWGDEKDIRLIPLILRFRGLERDSNRWKTDNSCSTVFTIVPFDLPQGLGRGFGHCTIAE